LFCFVFIRLKQHGFIVFDKIADVLPAAMETKIPAVIGSVKSAPFCLAKYARIVPTVVTFPYGTARITASYAIGGAKYIRSPPYFSMLF
jgi:hypothetical protein